MEMAEESINDIISITGCTRNEAAFYLESASGNMEPALQFAGHSATGSTFADLARRSGRSTTHRSQQVRSRNRVRPVAPPSDGVPLTTRVNENSFLGRRALVTWCLGTPREAKYGGTFTKVDSEGLFLFCYDDNTEHLYKMQRSESTGKIFALNRGNDYDVHWFALEQVDSDEYKCGKEELDLFLESSHLHGETFVNFLMKKK